MVLAVEYAAIALVEAGDQAFQAGQRAVAVAHWAEAAQASEHPAVAAMVALRRVHVEGNFAPMWQERTWTRALANCPISEPVCRLAHADRALFVPSFAGGSLDEAAELVTTGIWPSELHAAAKHREHLANRGTSWIDVPGSWTANLGLSYSQLSSAGAALRFVHPDVGFAGHRVEASAYGDLSGSWALNGRWFTPWKPATSLSVLGSQGWTYAWAPVDGVATGAGIPLSHGAFDARAAVQAVGTPFRVWTGIGVRYDSMLLYSSAALDGDCDGCVPAQALGDAQASLAFATASASWGSEPLRVSFRTEGGTGDYAHVALDAKLRTTLPIGPVDLAAQLAISATPLAEEPWWRWPSAGGSYLLRGLPAGRLRAPVMTSAQFELSRPIVGPLEGALFLDAASADSATWTAGGGVRLVLPPGRDNTTRLDFGAGPLGWGAVLSWGDAF